MLSPMASALPTSDWNARWARVVLSCGRCGHAVEVHIQRAAPLGKRLEAGERIPWRCEACGSGCIDVAVARP
jgi:hypothetical protein